MTINKNTFTGEFSYSLDTKGRVNIPAKFRNVLSKGNQRSFVITRLILILKQCEKVSK